MRNVAIVGAGQSGLLLAIGLLQHGYHVTLISNRSAEKIATGQVLSSPALFPSALQIEDTLGINYWKADCPKNETITFTLADKGKKTLSWRGHLASYYQAVDQRLKIPRWIETFEELGGVFVVKNTTIVDIEHYTKTHDLIIVASGKGELGHAFQQNSRESIFDSPQRTAALAYVKGMEPIPDKTGVCINVIPGIGEYFTMPGLTQQGQCEMMLFESVVERNGKQWYEVNTPQALLDKMVDLLKQFLPWEYERCQHITLTDRKATLLGAVTPLIRYPILTLPSGKAVLGMADTVVLNDPLGGQGANNATKCAWVYLQQILNHKHKPFDTEWMQLTFEHFWEKAKWTVQWTNSLLKPPLPHVQHLFKCAEDSPIIANYLANAFDDVSCLYPWINDPMATEEKIIQWEKSGYGLAGHEFLLKEISINELLRKLIKFNKHYVEHFKKSALMMLIRSKKVEDEFCRKKLLSCLQVFSDYFQKTVMLRSVLTSSPAFIPIAQQHLEEEFGHNQLLYSDRKCESATWDPILEATCSWFAWKMFTLDDKSKTLLMHFVLETSAHIFFIEADKVMKRFGDTNYFAIHAEADEAHSEMGLELLTELSGADYKQLSLLQKQGWEMLVTVCDRIAVLATTQQRIAPQASSGCAACV